MLLRIRPIRNDFYLQEKITTFNDFILWTIFFISGFLNFSFLISVTN